MNLLITGAWQQAKAYIPMIEGMGHQVRFLQYEKDELPCDDAWVEGIIGNGIFLSHPIERFSNLRYIQLTSAGFDRVPMDYVQAHGIEIHNVRGVYSIPMAEFAVAGVLTLYKQMRFFAERQKQHRWEKHRGLLELSGKNVLIVGCGSVGTECAKRFQAFGCHVVGVDLFPRVDSHYVQMVGLTELDKHLPDADIVVLTLPLTDETKHLMNADRLKRLKASAVLVNIARGGIMDTEALIERLPNIGGAVLDVFEEEPLTEDSPLWEIKNVLITPHNSFVSDGNIQRMWEVICANLEDNI